MGGAAPRRPLCVRPCNEPQAKSIILFQKNIQTSKLLLRINLKILESNIQTDC